MTKEATKAKEAAAAPETVTLIASEALTLYVQEPPLALKKGENEVRAKLAPKLLADRTLSKILSLKTK